MKNDDERADFIKRLDRSDVSVSDWEAQFINSTLQREHFSPKQREAIDRMAEKYRDI